MRSDGSFFGVRVNLIGRCVFSQPVGYVLLHVVQGNSGKRSILGALDPMQHIDLSAVLTYFLYLDYFHLLDFPAYLSLLFESQSLDFVLYSILLSRQSILLGRRPIIS